MTITLCWSGWHCQSFAPFTLFMKFKQLCILLLHHFQMSQGASSCAFATPPGLCNTTRGCLQEICHTILLSVFEQLFNLILHDQIALASIFLCFCQTFLSPAKVQWDALGELQYIRSRMTSCLKCRPKTSIANLSRVSSCVVAQPWGPCENTEAKGAQIWHCQPDQHKLLSGLIA